MNNSNSIVKEHFSLSSFVNECRTNPENEDKIIKKYSALFKEKMEETKKMKEDKNNSLKN